MYTAISRVSQNQTSLKMADPSSFYTLIFTRPSLYMNETLESSIANLVNAAFLEVPNFDNALRFQTASEVSKELGDDGIIAIAFDPVSGADRDKAVACISAKKYDPPEIDGSVDRGEEMLNYRLYAVATLKDPQYRKKGLIPLCLSALKAALPPTSQLWIETAEEANGPYWQSRGFELAKSEKKPKGFWGAEREFNWVVLRGGAQK